MTSWKVNNARRGAPINSNSNKKQLNLRDIMYSNKYKIEKGTGRILKYTQNKLSANDLREAERSCS